MNYDKKQKKKHFNNYKINDEYKVAFETLQNKIIRFCVILSIVSFIFEVLIMFHYIYSGKQFSNIFDDYILPSIIRPALINILIYLIGTLLYQNPNSTEEEKLAIPCLMLQICMMNIIFVQYMFTALYPLVVIPIYVSNTYGNPNAEKRITQLTTIISFFTFLAIAYFHKTELPEYFLYNVIFTFSIIFLSHYISLAIIMSEKEKSEILVEKIDLNNKLKEEVQYDGLTSLLNHETLVQKLNECCNSQKDNLCLSIIDIDHFKEVNDNYGHIKGDTILKKLADILKEIQTDDIIVGRYGGEEFVVILQNKTPEESFNIIDNVRKKFSKLSVEETNVCVTFSAGISSFKNAETAGDLFKRTDDILYKAKNNGRNKCIFEERN